MEATPFKHRIVVLDGSSDYDTLKRVGAHGHFPYEKDRIVSAPLFGAFSELVLLVREYEAALEKRLAEGFPSLEKLNEEARKNDQEMPTYRSTIAELHCPELSTRFKLFLIVAKAILDKLVPLYGYRFSRESGSFRDKGTKIIKDIRHNKHIKSGPELIELIENAKGAWLDDLVDLRDEYAHYSGLGEYRDFWIDLEGLAPNKWPEFRNFNRPSIDVAGKRIDALQYLKDTKENLVGFASEFVRHCDFSDDRRPRTYLHCDECRFEFARWEGKTKDRKGKLELVGSEGIVISVKDRDRNYGTIQCPKCGGETDTDLSFWEREGFIGQKIESA